MQLCLFPAIAAFLGPPALSPHRAPLSRLQALVADEEVDVVVVGSGIAGLSTAGLLASRGKKVAVLEQHYEIGGCAHEFCVGLDGNTIPTAALAKKPDTPVFRFEAGPSLYSGFSSERCHILLPGRIVPQNVSA